MTREQSRTDQEIVEVFARKERVILKKLKVIREKMPTDFNHENGE